MNGLQEIADHNQQSNANNMLKENQARLDQMYGYDPELMDEQQKEWWQKC